MVLVEKNPTTWHNQNCAQMLHETRGQVGRYEVAGYPRDEGRLQE
jgi:hypothetical protein